MCKEQRPLSTVRFLAEGLSLSPTANLPTSDVNQPNNDNDNALTPEEMLIFQRSYLETLARRDYSSSIPAQDIEEMRLRGLPPPSDEDIASARQQMLLERVHRDQREFAQWRQTQLARRRQWLLEMESRYNEPEEFEPGEYEFSDDADDDADDDDAHSDPDPNMLSATNDERDGSISDGLQNLESAILPQGPVETLSSAETGEDAYIADGEEDMRGELAFKNTEDVRSTMTPDQLQELGETIVQNVGDEEDGDDDVEIGDELRDMAQMVRSDDAGVAEQGYHALRSDSADGSELEEGEVRE